MRLRPAALLAAPVVIGALAIAAPAHAGTVKAAGGGGACTAVAPVPKTAPVRLSAAQIDAMVAYKETHDTPAQHAAPADPALVARKLALPARPLHECQPTFGPFRPNGLTSYQVLSPFYQYGQVTGYFCGPATVEEVSATTPGPSAIGLSQWTIASYMGTSSNGGTSTGGEVAGLNHYVGNPDFNFNYYMPVDMSYNPTSAERGTFITDLQYDLDHGTPTVGRAWEIAGGPHLVGHPVNEEIMHYFAIGGHDASL